MNKISQNEVITQYTGQLIQTLIDINFTVEYENDLMIILKSTGGCFEERQFMEDE